MCLDVLAELGTGWRHLTYDERARGRKSKRSADYSFAAALRDVDAVLAARAVDRPALLVGWSYGAVAGAHWAGRNPDRTLGAVLVDGAFPYDWLDDAMEQRIRKMFRRMGWFTPLLRVTGLTPGMTRNNRRTATSNSAGSAGSGNWAPGWTASPFPCGTWLLPGHRSAAAAMSRNGYGPASLR
jgi:pimeloyl-ACP methyl ester carboxylesterase